jgi:hypothetical protein
MGVRRVPHALSIAPMAAPTQRGHVATYRYFLGGWQPPTLFVATFSHQYHALARFLLGAS